MVTAPRKKMSFAIDDDKPKAKPINEETPAGEAAMRKTVATRLPPDLYRQAKARAALDQVSIQTVIETALREFIVRGQQ